MTDCGFVMLFGCSGLDEVQRERERLHNVQHIQVKEEPMEVPADNPPCRSPEVKNETTSLDPQQEKDSLNLFLQKPGSFSKLSKLLEVAKMSPESSSHSQGPLTSAAHVPSISQTTLPISLFSIPNKEIKSEPAAPVVSHEYQGSLQQQLHSDLYRALTEKNAHWFSLLPRSPCDNTSLSDSVTPTSSTSPQTCISKAQPPINSNTATQSNKNSVESSLSSGANQHATCSASPPTTAAIRNFSLDLQKVCKVFCFLFPINRT